MEKPSADYFKTEQEMPIDGAVLEDLIHEAESFLTGVPESEKRSKTILKSIGRAMLKGVIFMGMASGHGVPQ
jgi:hypothetical protein